MSLDFDKALERARNRPSRTDSDLEEVARYFVEAHMTPEAAAIVLAGFKISYNLAEIEAKLVDLSRALAQDYSNDTVCSSLEKVSFSVDNVTHSMDGIRNDIDKAVDKVTKTLKPEGSLT